ncbi:DUF6286 domain-containing Asp23/Gls24 family envelope stress response protein [Streptomyces sp. NBC_01264]|uniref:DUF6286 domain-containing Asp23/Gls24 family envelope stress response protein n=1 Tax=Streptomyces sp. NBC_01264 TaxID=2903804 RepID=UPI00224F492A|nr:DUF6286 domain-containing Asp23/Gls24 family envelope stress response protein [Streptomyces sp. NBC_01264]MCX4782855.1 Asp23/Gls24 family envelope stress response protein [Streptomyces sp. NBC_01264]
MRERGTTTIADRVVRKIAEQAARETVTVFGGRVARGTASVRGRSAQARVDLVLGYGGPAGDAARTVQDHVAERTTRLTGLQVPPPRIRVRKLTTAGRGTMPAAEDTPAVPGPGGTRRRTWSERRLPVAALAALALGGSAGLLRDLAAAHLQGRRPAQWRARAAEWLTHHGPATTPSWAAVALALAGVWMVALALTPGHRGDLAMAGSDEEVRAVISRRSVLRLLRAALAQAPAITGIRLRLSRRRLTVRARFTHGDEASARDAVAEAVAAVVRETGLAAPPRTSVRLRRASSLRMAPAPSKEGEPGGSHA